MKKTILVITAGFLFLASFAQVTKTDENGKQTLSKSEAADLFKSLNMDSTTMLSASGKDACHCIDSLMQARIKGKDSDVRKEANQCIEQYTSVYEMSLLLLKAMKEGNYNIVVNTDENSPSHQRHYRELEIWLMDSCAAIRQLLSSNEDKDKEIGASKDPKAAKYYNEGLNFLNKDDYAGALPYFKKAVEQDPKFVYALDNLAICYRRTNELDKALDYYNRSLAINPNGHTPIQNMPVIYELKKDYDKAIEGYKKMITLMPEDPEGYYGCGRILIGYKEKLEEGLDYMCKAYNIYSEAKSPYRQDAVTQISFVYGKMKKDGKEDKFKKILADNHIQMGE